MLLNPVAVAPVIGAPGDCHRRQRRNGREPRAKRWSASNRRTLRPAAHTPHIPQNCVLPLRQELRLGNEAGNLGLNDLVTGCADRQVTGVGFVEQPGQDRVVEDVPPSVQVRVTVAHLGVIGIHPITWQGCTGRCIIRPNLEAVVNPMRQGGAAGLPQRGGGCQNQQKSTCRTLPSAPCYRTYLHLDRLVRPPGAPSKAWRNRPCRVRTCTLLRHNRHNRSRTDPRKFRPPRPRALRLP